MKANIILQVEMSASLVNVPSQTKILNSPPSHRLLKNKLLKYPSSLNNISKQPIP